MVMIPNQTRTPTPAPRESDIQAQIRLALGQEPDLVLWRIQPGGLSDHTGRPIRTAPNGIADLCGILAPTGRWVALEVKTPGGRQSPAQQQWGRLLRSLGGFYAVVRSVDDARRAIERARKGADR